ncbi:splicing factor PWI domain-containing protein [Actinidia rufa]|uniref:Splicing factor PWI domain-containing protein n=1 Tax=Actinidia rufa TaxID=165716 RepID=A0A7J0H9V1_9ERIC|nr:splicing factor PWI domain-containing protein [Actinidia rufa]
MSGGFFRGTSADQDTRFSNKQARLLKSQKFAPELDNLVDMTKVKMDVVRPWIANRVTEFLGFEDEVLINFIYGLLDGKVVNGKEVQISLTGFMEKNTGKFMKELWVLLLSAQNNASGVPQQFLDTKEEETRKQKAETDRIADEIQKKKEKEPRELEQEKMRITDGEADISRANNATHKSNSKHELRASSAHSEDQKEVGERNGSIGRNRVSRSPDSADRSSLCPQYVFFPLEKHKSKSISQSPQHRGRSISFGKLYHSPPRRSVTPRWRYSPQRSLSPPRRRSSHSKRRSTSRPRHRSPSPIRRRLRSPLRRRSRSPIRPRSRSPVRRRSRSLVRYVSRSPMRRRSPSPVRRRSPSPVRRRSPAPLRRRSPPPMRGRSPSSMRRRYRRSPSTPRHRSLSPIRRRSPIPSRRRLPTPSRRRSPSPEEWNSPSPVRRLSPSPIRRKSPKCQRRSLVQSPRERIRTLEKLSPVRHAHTRENAENSAEIHKEPDSVVRRPPISLRSPQRDPRHRDNTRKKATSSSPSPYRSQSRSESPPGSRRRPSEEDKRSYSPHASPVRQTNAQKLRDISASPPRKPKDHKPRRDSPKASEEEEETNYARGNGGQKQKSSDKRSAYSLTADKHQDSVERVHYKDHYSLQRLAGHRSDAIRSRPDGLELRKKDLEIRSEKTSGRAHHPESSDQQLPTINKVSSLSERHRIASPEETSKADEKNHSSFNEVKGSKQLHETETAGKMSRKVDKKDRIGSLSSGSQESDKHHHEVHEKRKHKRRERQEVSSDDSSDSELEDRKEAKRRRKEEKRLRKEERRRRREERRRRRRGEQRSEKLKAQSKVN